VQYARERFESVKISTLSSHALPEKYYLFNQKYLTKNGEKLTDKDGSSS
jgi:hypothetical protein